MYKQTPTKTTAILAITFLVIGVLSGFLAGRASFQPQSITVVQTVERTVTATSTTTRVETKVVEVREPEVKYAKNFGIIRGEGYVLLKDGVNRTVLLVPRGAAVPNIKADLVVRTPVERVVLMSSTHVALVERLREYDPQLFSLVVGIMWGRSYTWFFPEVQKKLADGAIKDVGAAWSPDYEQIAALRPDLVMIYTFPGDPVMSKLDELKMPYVVNQEYLETDLLGRFEWIKFVAAFFQLDDAAAKVFRYVETSYLLTSARAKTLVEKGFEPQKKVVWFSVFRGTVYVAGGESYVAKALRDLGAAYVFGDAKTTGSAKVSVEELVARALDADVIVVSTDLVTSVEDLLKELPQLAQSKAVRENRVYRFNSNIYQLGYYLAEEWFRDVAEMLYPLSFTGDALDFFVTLR